MKKIALLLTFSLVALVAAAQPRTTAGPRPGNYSLNIVAQGDELFTVYVDGDQMNHRPSPTLTVRDLDASEHEVIVVISRPARKAAVAYVTPRERVSTLTVDYHSRTQQLEIVVPHADIRPERTGHRPGEARPAPRGGNFEQTIIINQPGTQQPEPRGPVVAGEDQVAAMVARLKGESFDDDRTALAHSMVASTPLSASQIARLAATFSFDNAKVEFLEYAFAYCVDRENYHVVTDVLTFSSDKQRVLRYAETHRSDPR